MLSNGEKATLLAVTLIEEQLRTLPLSLASIESAQHKGNPTLRIALKQKARPASTGSGGNIVADKAEHPDKTPAANGLEFPAGVAYDDPRRVTVSNAVLAVGAFLKAHEILSLRTPEIQFLSHVVDAILNANRLTLAPGYMPSAAFNGLVMTPELDGTPLFPERDSSGFMELGDAVALLQWLSRYLRGEQGYVSGGDAG